MKKFITIFVITIISMVTAINSYAQLTCVTQEEYSGYKKIFEAPMKYGEIRYLENTKTYILFGVTDNQFEKSMASIVLGGDKNSAIATLEDLRKIVQKETKFSGSMIVKGFNDKPTILYKCMGEFIFETQFVAGSTHVLWAMRNKFEDAKNAIQNFEE